MSLAILYNQYQNFGYGDLQAALGISFYTATGDLTATRGYSWQQTNDLKSALQALYLTRADIFADIEGGYRSYSDVLAAAGHTLASTAVDITGTVGYAYRHTTDLKAALIANLLQTYDVISHWTYGYIQVTGDITSTFQPTTGTLYTRRGDVLAMDIAKIKQHIDLKAIQGKKLRRRLVDIFGTHNATSYHHSADIAATWGQHYQTNKDLTGTVTSPITSNYQTWGDVGDHWMKPYMDQVDITTHLTQPITMFVMTSSAAGVTYNKTFDLKAQHSNYTNALDVGDES